MTEQIDPTWYVGLVESAPDAIVLIDSEGHILLVNAQTERLFGYSRVELIGRPVEVLIPERYRRTHMLRRDVYFGEPKVREMGAGIDLWGQRKDGTEFPVEISLSPLRTARGVFATAAIRDATARRKAQDKFRTLLEAAPDAMVIIDARGKINLVNAQAERMFGYAREALIGQGVEILVPEKLRARHLAHRAGYSKGPKVRPMGAGVELRGRRKDGTEFPLEISLSPLETEEGSWTTAAVRDITDRRGMEQARNLLASIVESSADAIITKDLQGVVTSWNHGAEQLFGYAAGEMIGKPISLLFPDGHDDEETRILTQLRAAGQRQQFETIRRRKDGSTIDVSVTISPVLDTAGQVIGASKIVRDISERKRVEERLERSNQDLEQFAYVASHDLQAPLRSVVGFAQLLQKKYKDQLDDTARDYFNHIVSSSTHMQALIVGLLEFSRVGRQDSALVPTSTETALGLALTQLRAVIEERQAVITHDPLPEVVGLEVEIALLFQNLISNAIKFQPAGQQPRIAITATRNHSTWSFAVTDNGIGMKRDNFSKLFKMFQRLHTLDQYDGTGIGLAICQKIVHRHGGRIWVESEPGKGSTFRFTLQAA